jgi:hypothetical protein
MSSHDQDLVCDISYRLNYSDFNTILKPVYYIRIFSWDIFFPQTLAFILMYSISAHVKIGYAIDHVTSIAGILVLNCFLSLVTWLPYH